MGFNASALLGFALWALRLLPVFSSTPGDEDFFVFFRDDFLLETKAGSALNRFYYHNSPYASEYYPPTQFQPVCVVTAGLDETTVKFIPQAYGGDLIPIFTVPAAGLDDGLGRFGRGGFDLFVTEPAALGMSADEIERIMERRNDLPRNWRARTVMIGSGERREFPARIRTERKSVADAVWRGVDEMSASDPSDSIRQMIWFGCLQPVELILRTSAPLALMLALVLWAAFLAYLWKFRIGAFGAMTASALAAAFSWWLFWQGPPDRDLVAALPRIYARGQIGDFGSLLKNASPRVRYAALRRLVEKPDPVCLENALKLFNDPDPRVRMRAVEFTGTVMGKIAFRNSENVQKTKEEAQRLVVSALRDDFFLVRCRAIEAIAKMRLTQAEGDLLQLIEKNEHLYVTWYAVKTLRRLNSARKGRT
jgi:hypothetical protein